MSGRKTSTEKIRVTATATRLVDGNKSSGCSAAMRTTAPVAASSPRMRTTTSATLTRTSGLAKLIQTVPCSMTPCNTRRCQNTKAERLVLARASDVSRSYLQREAARKLRAGNISNPCGKQGYSVRRCVTIGIYPKINRSGNQQLTIRLCFFYIGMDILSN